MSFRYGSGINKPGFNALAAQTTTYTYELYSWGSNGFGQLGLNNTTNYSSPKQVGSLTTWLSLSAGRYFSAAIKTDGTLWTWGRNDKGQLGLSNTTSYYSPKQVGALTTWATVKAGSTHCAAIKTNGTLWTWGMNFYGQLGLNSATYSFSSPQQVGALTTWATIASLANSVLAVKTDGTLWSWGRNSLGQLGLGNTTNYSSPMQIGALTAWSSLGGQESEDSSASIKTNGTLWTWGSNDKGQLGQTLSTATNISSPVQVGALTTWYKVIGGGGGAGYMSSVKTDGTLWSWGGNDYGQLGIGNTTDYSSPKQVGALTTWLNVYGGGRHNSASKVDGTLWTWGQGNYGALGLGNITTYSSPKQVGALTTWLTVASGRYNILALKY